MNTREALEILEFEIRDFYLTNPDMQEASQVLHVALNERDILRKALDGMLDWALANRGSEHEFVRCKSDGDLAAPALVAARAALAPVKGEACP